PPLWSRAAVLRRPTMLKKAAKPLRATNPQPSNRFRHSRAERGRSPCSHGSGKAPSGVHHRGLCFTIGALHGTALRCRPRRVRASAHRPHHFMKPPIRLIIGLGNPGPEYEATRHNAGFWLADQLADDLHASFTLEKGFSAWVAKARVNGEAVLLAKPTTFMNRSGQAAGALMRFYKLTPEQVLVLHDELDLMPGQAKIKQGGGHAGHNGLRDIQSAFSSPDFWRLRIGIGH